MQREKGDYDEALDFYNKELTIKRKVWGDNNIAVVKKGKGDYDAALISIVHWIWLTNHTQFIRKSWVQITPTLSMLCSVLNI